MAQDPWRRAYQMQRLKQAGAPAAGEPPPPRRRSRTTAAWLILLMLALGAGGYCAWLSRDRWAMQLARQLPGMREELPAPVRDVVPAPRRSVDQAALEEGLGLHLTVFANSYDLIAATRAWGVEWRLTSMGDERARMSAGGVKVYATGGVIEYYDIDVAEVYAAPAWKQWQPALRRAGISPELTWELLTGVQGPAAGNQDYEYRSARSVRRPEGATRQAFILRFVDGRLRHVEGQISLGPAIPPGPVTREAPRVETPQPGAPSVPLAPGTGK
jgi:hypothetical protein